MEDTRGWPENASPRGARFGNRHPKPFAANDLYLAYLDGDGLHINQHDLGTDSLRRIALRPHGPGSHCSISFSTSRPGLLACSSGASVAVRDVTNDSSKAVVFCTDRAITSLAWSIIDPDLLAVGHVDGRVSVWDVTRPSGPLHLVNAGYGPTNCLTWSHSGENLLAASVAETLHIWRVGPTTKRLGRLWRLAAEIEHLVWHPHTATKLLVGYSANSLALWDVALDLRSLILEGEDDDDELFGELEDVQSLSQPVCQIVSRSSVQHVVWIGEHGIAVLNHQGDKIVAFDLLDEESQLPVWEHDFASSMDSVATRFDGESFVMIGLGRGAPEKIVLPQNVAEQLGPIPQRNIVHHELCAKQPYRTDHQTVKGLMKPITISQLKAERGDFSYTAQQVRAARKRSQTKLSVRPATAESAHFEITAMPVAPSMTSSLELPKPQPEEDDSPMPFLSPTIPSRKASPSAIPSLKDELTLPPPPDESFDSVPSTAAPDTDSDDEIFDGTTMLGSGNLMLPGGVNVPLPKSCGALFAANGQLVTYFPPKPRSSAKADELEPGSTLRSSKVARAFPTFGNFGNRFTNLGHDSDSESIASADSIGLGGSSPIELPPSTPDSQAWHSKFSPSKRNLSHAGNQRSVNVSVREIDEFSNLRQDLATRYSLACESAAGAPMLTEANAQVASNLGLGRVANLWRLVGHALSKQGHAAEDGAASGIDSLDFGAPFPGVTESTPSMLADTKLSPESSQFVMAAHMLGESWLVAQVLGMAESTADLQTLGCISALLLSHAATVKDNSRSSFNSHSGLHSTDYFAKQQTRQPAPRPIPLLRNDSRDSVVIHRSPTKHRPNSKTSSRNPSQPTTPRPDSLSSTPPYPFPNLSRQGSRISTSGSASPETHRSSFSAAAKYYAQSITEKFSTYGTSPPTKRLGTSPGNELSFSLPTGSWGKSVSFASTTDTAQDSRQSGTQSSYNDDDGYDSDRTIEDSSLPHTPKSGSVEIMFKTNDAFESQTSSDRTENALLPPLLLVKAQVWVRSYAEQLRAWDMIIEAAELESLAGPETPSVAHMKPDGVVPVPVQGQRKPACSICYVKIDGLQQSCSRCLHTMHLSCLTAFLEDCGAEDFECPTGCGCRCTDLSYEEVEWMSGEELETLSSNRKRSLTDPRVWRARVEGASW